MKKLILVCFAIFLLFGFAGFANAVVIDFTGGNATLVGGGIVTTTPGYEVFSATDYYVENGFKLDFINSINGEIIGDYYDQDASGQWNDVIHGHWAPYGTMTAIEITKVGGGTFDLNYFILTSNTQIGGGSATGNELTYIEAWVSGSMTYTQLLPPDSWGWNGVQNPGPLQNDPQIYPGSQFDAVDLVRFTIDNDVFCFGMDEFYIDEEAPAPVPEPATMLLIGSGLIGLAGFRRKFRKR